MLFNFENLQVWQLSEDLAVAIYRLLRNFPEEERFGICSQMRRAVTSVSFNLAESSGRSNYKDKIRFIEIADGSLKETYSQLHLSVRLGYIQQNDFENLQGIFLEIENKLRALRRSYQANIDNGKMKPLNF